MLNILEMTLPELTQWVTGDLGLPKFRSQQIWQWVWQRMARSFDEMTNISKPVREELSKKAQIVWPEVDKIQTSSDSTTKFLLRLGDGERVETVLIPSTSREIRTISHSKSPISHPHSNENQNRITENDNRNINPPVGLLYHIIFSPSITSKYHFHPSIPISEATQSQWLSHRMHTRYHNPTMHIPILNPISKSLSPTHEKHTP